MSIINDVVHLLRNPLTADPKETYFPGYQKVQRSRLERITRQMNLLREIKTVVHRDGSAAGRTCVKLVQLIGHTCLPCILHHCTITVQDELSLNVSPAVLNVHTFLPLEYSLFCK